MAPKSVLRHTCLGGTLLGASLTYAQAPSVRIPVSALTKLSSQAQRVAIRPRPPRSAPKNQPKPKPKQTPREWLNDNLFDRLDVTGNRSLAYHAYSVDGDRSAFGSTTNYGNGNDRFTDTGFMTIDGRRVLGVLDFQLQFTDNRIHDPDATRTTLNYDRGPLKVSLGDIRGSLLNSNRYARFSRQLKGAMAGYQSGRLELRGLRSDARSSARTVSIQGSNSSGPYYLQSGRVIGDSVQVQVDGQPMRLLDDFVVDSELGAITFVNRIIAPTSTIVVSYEANGFNSSGGTIQGVAAGYNFGQIGRLAVTTMSQTTGARTGSSYIDDPWEGQGAPSQAYTLAYEPLEGTVTVRIDGVLQVEGVDYFFDSLVKSKLYMTRYIPSSRTVLIRYRPKAQTVVNGDRRVIGADYQLPFGKQGYLQYSMARGERFRSDTPTSGIAQGWDAQYKLGLLTFRGSVRDVPRGFVSIESQGFSRNERAADVSVAYNLARWEYGFSNTNSSVVSTTSSARVTKSSAFARFEGADGTSYTLEHNRSFSRQSTQSRLDSTSLATRRRFGRLSAGLDFEVQNGLGPISNGTDTQVGNLGLQTVRTTAAMDFGRGFGVNSRFGLSNIQARGQQGTGTELTLNANYRPSERWSLTTGVTQSNSGQLASLGSFANGSGYGYDGNGFSGGSADSSFSGVGTNNVRRYQLATVYQVSDRLGLDGHWTDNTTEGDLSSNSQTRAYGFGVNYDFGRFHLLNLSLDQTATRYLGSVSTRSDSTLLSASFTGSPKGRWSYRLGYSGSISGQRTTYSQNTDLAETSLSYRLSPRQRVTTAYYQSRTTGYYGQFDRALSFLYDYQIYRNVALVGSWRSRRVANLDSALSTGAYRSAGFDLALSFDFAP